VVGRRTPDAMTDIMLRGPLITEYHCELGHVLAALSLSQLQQYSCMVNVRHFVNGN